MAVLQTHNYRYHVHVSETTIQLEPGFAKLLAACSVKKIIIAIQPIFLSDYYLWS